LKNVDENSRGARRCSGFIQFSGYPPLTHSHIKNSWGQYFSFCPEIPKTRKTSYRKKKAKSGIAGSGKYHQ